jgi:hypothetical protein
MLTAQEKSQSVISNYEDKITYKVEAICNYVCNNKDGNMCDLGKSYTGVGNASFRFYSGSVSRDEIVDLRLALSKKLKPLGYEVYSSILCYREGPIAYTEIIVSWENQSNFTKWLRHRFDV